jgi:hypothetical protein
MTVPRASGASCAESRESSASCSIPGAAAGGHSGTRIPEPPIAPGVAVLETREDAFGSHCRDYHHSRRTPSSAGTTHSSATTTGRRIARRCAQLAIDATVPRWNRRIDGLPGQQPKRRLPAPRPFALLATSVSSCPLSCDAVTRRGRRRTARGNRLALTPPRILVLLRGGYLDERTSVSNQSPDTLDHDGRAHRAAPSLAHFRKCTPRSRPTRRNDAVGSHHHTAGDDPSPLPTPLEPSHPAFSPGMCRDDSSKTRQSGEP